MDLLLQMCEFPLLGQSFVFVPFTLYLKHPHFVLQCHQQCLILLYFPICLFYFLICLFSILACLFKLHESLYSLCFCRQSDVDGLKNRSFLIATDPLSISRLSLPLKFAILIDQSTGLGLKDSYFCLPLTQFSLSFPQVGIGVLQPNLQTVQQLLIIFTHLSHHVLVRFFSPRTVLFSIPDQVPQLSYLCLA